MIDATITTSATPQSPAEPTTPARRLPVGTMVVGTALAGAAVAGLVTDRSTVETIGWSELFLVLVALAVGVWNTAIGSTGGVMFATTAAVLSPTVAIPVQSIVEGISAAYRLWALRVAVNFGFLGIFSIGGVGGGFAGYLAIRRTLAAESDDLFRLLVGLLIIAVTWTPMARFTARARAAPLVAGALTTFICLFVGGMGAPVSAALEGRGEDHRVVMATTTGALYLQYVLRIALFGAFGAVIVEYQALIVILTAASLLGTWLGRRLLFTVDQAKARSAFRVVVTAIGISMVLRAVL